MRFSAAAQCELVAVLVGALGACTASPERSATVDSPPDDIAWVTAFAVDADGAVVAAAPLTRRVDDDVGAELPDGWTMGVTGWVVGFSDEALNAVAPSFVSTGAPVRMALSSDLPLPAPTWAITGSIDDGHALLTEPSDAPPTLTVDGLPSCPERFVAPTALVDTRCRHRPCEPEAMQSGCRLILDLSTCELPIYEGVLDGVGDFIGDGCTNLQEPPDVDATLLCNDLSENCTIHLYSAPAELNVEVTVNDLHDPFVAAPRSGYEVVGYTAGLAMVGGTLIVADYDGAQLDDSCATLTTSRLVSLDAVTLETRATVPTVDCVRQLTAHPDGVSLLALAGGPVGVRFLQLAVDGTTIGTPLELVAADNTQYGRILVHGDGAYASVLELVRPDLDARIHTIDLNTFTLVSTSERMPDIRDFGDANRLDTLVLVNQNDELLEFYDFRSPTAARVKINLDPCLFNFDPVRLLTLPDGRAYAVGEKDESALAEVMLTEPERRCRASAPFVEPTDLRRPVGPLSNGDIVVAGRNYEKSASEDERRAFLSVYRPQRPGFLPAKIDIGVGLPNGVIAVGDVVYVLLPWAGDVVRVAFDVAN